MNIGEEICGEWLKHIKGCEFVTYNLKVDRGGEIDVVGIDIKDRHVYVCEVAIHLQTGIRYVDPKTKRPDNVNRFTKKFLKDCNYIRKAFPGYKATYMLWSPIVRVQKQETKYNQMEALQQVVANCRDQHGIEVALVINQTFWDCLEELRNHARKESKELFSSVMRYMQIETKLRDHLDHLQKSQKKS